MALVEYDQLLAPGRAGNCARTAARSSRSVRFPKAMKIGIVTAGALVLMSKLLNRAGPERSTTASASTPAVMPPTAHRRSSLAKVAALRSIRRVSGRCIKQPAQRCGDPPALLDVEPALDGVHGLGRRHSGGEKSSEDPQRSISSSA